MTIYTLCVLTCFILILSSTSWCPPCLSSLTSNPPPSRDKSFANMWTLRYNNSHVPRPRFNQCNSCLLRLPWLLEREKERGRGWDRALPDVIYNLSVQRNPPCVTQYAIPPLASNERQRAHGTTDYLCSVASSRAQVLTIPWTPNVSLQTFVRITCKRPTDDNLR